MGSQGSIKINDGIAKDSSYPGFSSFELSLFCSSPVGGSSYLVYWRRDENMDWSFRGLYPNLHDAEIYAASLVAKIDGQTRVSDYPRIEVPYSKTIKRIASPKNPVGRAKMAVSDYAGCDEASMVRKRIIAIAARRVSISEEEFRFRLP